MRLWQRLILVVRLLTLCVLAPDSSALAQHPNEPPPKQGLYILASTGMRPPGTRADTSLVDFGVPAINSRGQVAFFALTREPSDVPGESRLGRALFRIDPDGRWTTVLLFARSRVAASVVPPSLEYADCVINDRGDIATIGMDWVRPGTRRPQQILSTTKADDPLLRLAESDGAAPGIADMIFDSFASVRLSENGRVVFIARLAQKGAPLRREIDNPVSAWTSVRGEASVLLMKEDDPAPGLDPARIVSGVTGIKCAGDWVTIDARIRDSVPGQPALPMSRPAVWTWHPERGFQLLLQAGDPVPTLPPGSIVQYATAADVDDRGNTLVCVSVARPPTSRELDMLVLARNSDGGWRRLIRVGDSFIHAGQQRAVLKVGSALWGRTGENEPILDIALADEPPNPRQFPHLVPWRFPAGGEPTPLFSTIPPPAFAGFEGLNFRYIGGVVLGPAGDAYFQATFGREDENGRPSGSRLSAVAHVNRLGQVRVIQFDSGRVRYAPGAIGGMVHTQVPSSGMSVQGELVFKLYLDNGVVAIAKAPAEQAH